MKHESLQRTHEESFDDLLAEGRTLEEISFILSWSMFRVKRRYRQVCADLGEHPDEV